MQLFPKINKHNESIQLFINMLATEFFVNNMLVLFYGLLFYSVGKNKWLLLDRDMLKSIPFDMVKPFYDGPHDMKFHYISYIV